VNTYLKTETKLGRLTAKT